MRYLITALALFVAVQTADAARGTLNCKAGAWVDMKDLATAKVVSCDLAPVRRAARGKHRVRVKVS